MSEYISMHSTRLCRRFIEYMYIVQLRKTSSSILVYLNINKNIMSLNKYQQQWNHTPTFWIMLYSKESLLIIRWQNNKFSIFTCIMHVVYMQICKCILCCTCHPIHSHLYSIPNRTRSQNIGIMHYEERILWMSGKNIQCKVAENTLCICVSKMFLNAHKTISFGVFMCPMFLLIVNFNILNFMSKRSKVILDFRIWICGSSLAISHVLPNKYEIFFGSERSTNIAFPLISISNFGLCLTSSYVFFLTISSFIPTKFGKNVRITRISQKENPRKQLLRQILRAYLCKLFLRAFSNIPIDSFSPKVAELKILVITSEFHICFFLEYIQLCFVRFIIVA